LANSVIDSVRQNNYKEVEGLEDVKVLVLAAQQWSFKDDNGEQRNGSTVYVSHLGHSDVNHYILGHKPVKYILSKEEYDIFAGQNLPAMAQMQTSYDFDRQKLVPTGFSDFESIVI
jgi:uncharacterized protein YjaZ